MEFKALGFTRGTTQEAMEVGVKAYISKNYTKDKKFFKKLEKGSKQHHIAYTKLTKELKKKYRPTDAQLQKHANLMGRLHGLTEAYQIATGKGEHFFK